ncbi:MAG: tyrosine recombinase [Candidatus Coatesbacteria bacterium]|nr:MAG: tyrosine recombinase [Candidatus Coatesbacteria bacterium]
MIDDAENSKDLRAEDARLLRGFAAYLTVERGLASTTVAAYESDVRLFLSVSEKPLLNVALPDVTAALRELGREGRSVATLNRMASALRVFYRYLAADGELGTSPLEYLQTARLEERLPDYLFRDDVERIITAAAAALKDAEGREVSPPERFRVARDAAMLALAYASGLRATELVNLPVRALDRRLGFVQVVGKGSKERLVPFGSVAAGHLDVYLDNYRPLSPVESDFVFIRWGGKDQISRQTFWGVVKKYAAAAGVPGVKPHTFRHSFATHLIQAGADLRTVQELLGHANISTTQIYTQLDVKRLQEIHRAAHPRK